MLHFTKAILLLLLLSLFATKLISASDTTTSGTVIIRRKLPSKLSPGGGGRFTLINSRFNKRPKKKHLDRDQLMDILGNFYNPDIMSAEEPPALANHDPERGASYVYRYDTWQHEDLMRQLQTKNLSEELSVIGGKAATDSLIVKMMEKWLLKRASCPVKYAWEDIGNLFWPRYIKRGECTNVPGTCSWPPGMHCVPSGTTTIYILRWQCKVPRSGKTGRRRTKLKDWTKKISNNDGDGSSMNLRCSWVRVPYPITNECLCTC